ncbi:hypothetical protein [Cellulomonas sp.]|uniref:hypothetical protein n=1 Tax=Cellulomonas sp. TaxID=40001 RepID=UPI001B0060E1|nr:hypothetical protein [Cellulomonas sp.]MBO9555295.1 hypothetical protein [Cellulomonas sp.]
MKSFWAKIAVGIGILSLLVVGAPTAASATGNYEWQCVQLNGVQTPMSPGEELINCQGYRLKKYLDGKLIATYKINSVYPVSGNPPSAGCIIDAGLVVVGIYTASGIIVWLATAVAGLRAWQTCKA